MRESTDQIFREQFPALQARYEAGISGLLNTQQKEANSIFETCHSFINDHSNGSVPLESVRTLFSHLDDRTNKCFEIPRTGLIDFVIPTGVQVVELLPRHRRREWWNASRQIKETGFCDPEPIAALRDRRVRAATRIGLDQYILLSNSFSSVSLTEKSTGSIQFLNDHASSPITRKAFAQADLIRLKHDLIKTAIFNGARSELVQEQIRTMKDVNMRKIMKYHLDAWTWREVLSTSRIYNSSSFEAWQKSDNIINPHLRRIVGRILRENPNLGQEERERERQQQDRQWQQREREYATRAHIPIPRQDGSVESIISSAIYRDPKTRWLKNEDQSKVAAVIGEVKNLRDQAAKRGEELSDRAMLLAFRREIEKPKDEVCPEKANMYQILNALMGGMQGKLVF